MKFDDDCKTAADVRARASRVAALRRSPTRLDKVGDQQAMRNLSIRARIRRLEHRKWLPEHLRNTRAGCIILAVAAEYHIGARTLLGRTMRGTLFEARKKAITLLRQELGYSLMRISKLFNRSHTTILHYVDEERRQRDLSRMVATGRRKGKNQCQTGG